MRNLLITRFSIYQHQWKVRTSDEWLDHRWPLFVKTAESVSKQTVAHTWLLICHRNTPSSWVRRLDDVARVILVGDNWLEDLRKKLPSGPKITTRLDSDDLIAPNYLEVVNTVDHDGFICTSSGYQEMDGVYYHHDEDNGPFLSLVEKGVQIVYSREHGKALKRERVYHIDDQRLYVQRVHDRNLRNKLRSSEPVPQPDWI